MEEFLYPVRSAMMLQPNQFALFFTVALLAITAYFLLGSVPLLILKHDNPVDSRFIRSFYITYFRMAFVAAVGTAASYALASRTGFAVGAAAIATLTLVLRARLIPRDSQVGDFDQHRSARRHPRESGLVLMGPRGGSRRQHRTGPRTRGRQRLERYFFNS